MRFAETLPSLFVVPDTITVLPLVTSESVPSTLLDTVVSGVMSTTCELPSRVLSTTLPDPVLVIVPASILPLFTPRENVAVVPPRAPANEPPPRVNALAVVVFGEKRCVPATPIATPIKSATTPTPMVCLCSIYDEFVIHTTTLVQYSSFLLVAEGFDRVHARSAARWVPAKHDTDNR